MVNKIQKKSVRIGFALNLNKFTQIISNLKVAEAVSQNLHFFILFVSYLVFLINYPLSTIYSSGEFVYDDYSHNLYIVTFLIFQFVVFGDWFLSKKAKRNKSTLKNYLSKAIVLGAVSLFIYPLASSDVFSYVGVARQVVLYGSNPYVYSFSNFTFDSFYTLIFNHWSNYPVIYGPVFIYITLPSAIFFANNIFFSVLTLKVLSFVSFMLLSVVFYKLTKNITSFFLLLFNPVFIFEFVVNAHNDVYLLLAVFASLMFLKQADKSELHSFMAITLLSISVLIKFYTVVLFPFYLIFLYKKLERDRWEKLIFIFKILLTQLVVLIFYFPFWDGLATFNRIGEVLQLKSIFVSPFILVFSSILKLGGDSFVESIKSFMVYTRLAYWAVYLLLVYLFLNAKELNFKKLALFLIYVVTFAFLLYFNWLMPWYLTLLLGLLILYHSFDQRMSTEYAIFALSLYHLMHYFILM